MTIFTSRSLSLIFREADRSRTRGINQCLTGGSCMPTVLPPRKLVRWVRVVHSARGTRESNREAEQALEWA